MITPFDDIPAVDPVLKSSIITITTGTTSPLIGYNSSGEIVTGSLHTTGFWKTITLFPLSNPAVLRIGKSIDPTFSPGSYITNAENEFENANVFKRVTIANTEDNIDAVNLINTGRQGKDITSLYDFDQSTAPMLRSSDNISSKQSVSIVDHSIGSTNFGQPRLFKEYDPNDSGTFYDDRMGDKISPAKIIGNALTTGSSGYYAFPVVRELTRYFDQSSLDGAIEIFQIRETVTNLLTSDMTTKKISCDMMINEDRGKGSSIISNVFEVKDLKSDRIYDFFEDAQDLRLGRRFSTEITSGETAKVYSDPGLISLGEFKLKPYADDFFTVSGSYSFMTRTQIETLASSSIRNFSEVGSRFKSATSGLIFGESNVLGTDSIAFGGLKK